MSCPLPHLRGFTPESLAACWPDLHLGLDQARRIVSRAVSKDQQSLEGVPGVPARVLAAVASRSRADRLAIVDRRESQVDPFVKYLFRSTDGVVFESVRIPLEKPRYSICV